MKRTIIIIMALTMVSFGAVGEASGFGAFNTLGFGFSPYFRNWNPWSPAQGSSSQQPSRTQTVGGTVYNHSRSPLAMKKVAIKKLGDSATSAILWRQSDTRGMYSVRLGDGQWIMSACGSSSGFSPIYWKVQVINGNVVNYESVDVERIEINDFEYSVSARRALPGVVYLELNRTLRLVGKGFGCSGRVVLDFGQFGQMEVTDFSWSSNKKIIFQIPPNVFSYVQSMNGGREVDSIRAHIFYVNGNLRSNPIDITITRRPAW